MKFNIMMSLILLSAPKLRSEGSTIHRITFRKAIKLNTNRNSKLATEFVVLRKIMKLAA